MRTQDLITISLADLKMIEDAVEAAVPSNLNSDWEDERKRKMIEHVVTIFAARLVSQAVHDGTGFGRN